MSYSHLLVSVAVSPESHQLVARAVSIARPHNARISLITLAAEPEMYNQLAAPMLEDIREVLQEETQQFLRELVEKVLNGEIPDAKTQAAALRVWCMLQEGKLS